MEEMKKAEECVMTEMEMDSVTNLIKAGHFELEIEEKDCDKVKNLSNNIEWSKEDNESTPIKHQVEPKHSLIPRK